MARLKNIHPGEIFIEEFVLGVGNHPGGVGRRSFYYISTSHSFNLLSISTAKKLVLAKK